MTDAHSGELLKVGGGSCSMLAFLHALGLLPSFDSGELSPDLVDGDLDPFSPPRALALVLVSGVPTPFHVSLLRRWQRAARAFAAVDVGAVLSVSDEEALPTYPSGAPASSAAALRDDWARRLQDDVPVHLVTTADIRAKWPYLHPKPEILSLADAPQYGPTPKPFEWAHHEPTFLCVPGIHRYAYVWVSEQDTVYKGNLTRWMADVRFDDPRADFLTWNVSAPDADWPFVYEGWSQQPHALHEQAETLEDHMTRPTDVLEPMANASSVVQWTQGRKLMWATGFEHLRMWSRGFLQVLASYFAQGMYIWGEAMSPSLCQANAFLDCRVNESWFVPHEMVWVGPEQVLEPPAWTVSNWTQLADNTWHNNFAADWDNVSWPASRP